MAFWEFCGLRDDDDFMFGWRIIPILITYPHMVSHPVLDLLQILR